MRHGPYQGLIQYHRLPNRPCTSVSPTQTSVQNVSGRGLDSGSRLPKNPAAMSAANTAKEIRLSGSRSASPGPLPSRRPRRPSPFQRFRPDEKQHDETRRDRERPADQIVPGRQQQHMAAVGRMGEGRGGGESCEQAERSENC